MTLFGHTAALLLVFGLLPAVAISQTPAESTPVEFRLDDHRWEHRVLLVFAASDTSDALRAQEDAFAGRDAGFRERHLVLVTLWGGGADAASTGTVRDAPGGVSRPMTSASAVRLRERFGVAPTDFRVILVGKDGTEKSRDAAPTTIRAVFDRIDAMPMRQREMRRQNDG